MAISLYLISLILARKNKLNVLEIHKARKNRGLSYGEIMAVKLFLEMKKVASPFSFQKKAVL